MIVAHPRAACPHEWPALERAIARETGRPLAAARRWLTVEANRLQMSGSLDLLDLLEAVAREGRRDAA